MTRKSGEPYISHPVAVTELLAEMHLDADALIAGLLHDTVEDTDVTFEEIESRFGASVRRIVEGETKISKLKVASDRGYEDEQAENLRQMLLAMVSDVRIILVKTGRQTSQHAHLEVYAATQTEAHRSRDARYFCALSAPLGDQPHQE